MKKLSLIALMAFLLFACKEKVQETTPTQIEKKVNTEEAMQHTAAAYANAWNSHDPESFNGIVAEKFTRKVNGTIAANSLAAFKEVVSGTFNSFPDFIVTVHETVVTGNTTYTSWTAQGTQLGAIGEVPASGKKTTFSGISLSWFNDAGEMISEDSYFDSMAMYGPLGFTMAPPTAE